VGINSLTAILKVQNGDLLKQEETKDVMGMAITEAVKRQKPQVLILM